MKITTSHHIKGWLIISIITGMLLFFDQSHAAQIEVNLDRDTISINDSFTAIYQVTGSVDDEPDFSALQKDFVLLSKHRRSNLTIINGQRNSTVEWLVELMAKREGKLTIPAVMFGKQQSPTASVTVTKTASASGSQQDDDIFVEVEAVPQATWVQAQILYTIRLFRTINTFNSSLSEPETTGGQVISEKLEDRQYEISRNNKRYVVLERRYALFPQSSGTITIAPVVFQGQVSQRSRHLFDPFGQNSRSIKRQSDAITLEVDPVPTSYKGTTWLPATKLELDEKWLQNEADLVVGEPITRTIVIKAEGLTAEQLPEVGSVELDNFKIYPDQPELSNRTANDGILGIRQEKSAVISTAPGEYVLPAIKLPWWNTQTGKMEIAELSERVINVLPVAGDKPTTEQDKHTLEAIDPTQTETILTVDQQGWSHYLWPWLSFILALGWIGTLFLWWQSRKNNSLPSDTTPQLTERSSLRALRNTIRIGEPTQIKNALMDWGRSVWQEDPPSNLAEIGARTNQAVATEVLLLNQALYGREVAGKPQWNAEHLLLAIENYDGQKFQNNRSKKDSQQQLEPLYKIS